MPQVTGAATFQSREFPQERLVRMVLLALIASLFTAASAQISVHVPFSPLPITGQTLAVLLTGALLGARAGGLAMLFYLGEGALGLPFFAGGAGGAAALAGFSAGYLWAFPPAAFLAGLLVERQAGRYGVAPTLLALLLADALIFACGVLWLGHFFHVGLPRAEDLGLWGYIPGDLVKIILVAIVLPGGRSLVDAYGWGLPRA